MVNIEKEINVNEDVLGKSIIYNNCTFKVISYHKLYNKYHVIIQKGKEFEISGMFIEKKYLVGDNFKKEVARCYEVFKEELT